MCEFSRYSKRELAYRNSVIKLGGRFESCNVTSIPQDLRLGDVVILSGKLCQGICSKDCIVLYRTEPFGEWTIHGSEFSEQDYNLILHTLNDIKSKETH